jgi:Transglutaminase-like superfamily
MHAHERRHRFGDRWAEGDDRSLACSGSPVLEEVPMMADDRMTDARMTHNETPMPGELAYYASPGVMTNLAGLDPHLDGVPTEAAEIALMVQGLVVHRFWASAYGVEVPGDREAELQTRPAAGMILRMLELDPRPLTESRPPGRRFVGNCRHFSALTTALLRRVGIPARARCGFANYFEPGKWVDHWVVEHWDGGRWVLLDSQVDAFQREALSLIADTTDLPAGMFLRAGEAWQRCQAGTEDGDRFGILDLWGQWFIAGNIARDLAALNKVEMLPWDGWGTLAADQSGPEPAYTDEIAELTLSADHAAIRRRYESDAGLRVPHRVISFYTPAGPTEVEVAEVV